MSDIQQARDVLAKWRKTATRENWFISFKDEHGWVDIAVQDGGIVDGGSDEGAVHADLAALIVGTAGNPDLLDAIDALLHSAGQWVDAAPGIAVPEPIQRIAAAIVAADERMSA